MTEEEWLTSDEWETLLNSLDLGLSNERKARLYACACCHRIKHNFTERGLHALATAERFADGQANREDLLAIRPEPQHLSDDFGTDRLSSHAACFVVFFWEAPSNFLSAALYAALAADEGSEVERRYQAALVREIFGNPFRPVAFDPAWRTDTAVAVARQMYDSRNFGAMPILADALQDAGCEDEHILAHCRDTSAPHVRGCWVCDLVLAK